MTAMNKNAPISESTPSRENSRIHDLVNAMLACQLRLDALQTKAASQSASSTLGRELEELRTCLDEASLIVQEMRIVARTERLKAQGTSSPRA